MVYKRLGRASSAFTIVELLVVIVVIGILAAITIVSYTGMSSRATVSSLQSDLNNASTQFKLFQIDNSNFPTTIDCTIPDNTINKCVKFSNGTIYQYAANNNASPQTFCTTATKDGYSYNINQDGVLTPGGKNIIPISLLTNVTAKTTNSFEAQVWASPILNNAQVLAIFEPNTGYHIKAKYTLKANSALPVYDKSTQFNLYSSSTGSFIVGVTHTLTNIGDTYDVDLNFTTPAVLGDKQLLLYSNRYSDGVTVELGKVLVENLKIEKGNVATCWTPGA